jgi:hypothetical protein
VLSGALGFGVGGIISSIVLNYLPLIAFLLFGLVGGMFLGINSRDTKRISKLGILGLLGSLIIFWPIVLVPTRTLLALFFGPFVFLVVLASGGMIQGVLFSLVTQRKIPLIVAGGVGVALVFLIFGIPISSLLVASAISSLILGIFFGIGMYLAEIPKTEEAYETITN